MRHPLDPGFAAIAGLRGDVRTIGSPPKAERTAAKHQRHRIAKGPVSRAGYFRTYNRRPERRAYLARMKRAYRAAQRGDTHA